MTTNKNKKIMIFGLLLVLIVLVMVVSFAAFSYLKQGSRVNTITLGSLKVSLTDGDYISLDEIYPLTNKDGIEVDGYSFVLENEGDAAVTYKIYIDNVDIESPQVKLDDKYIKYMFIKNGVESNINYLTSLGTNGNRVIDSGILTKEDGKINYNIKLWPTTDIDGEFAGQAWKAKIRVEVEQLH